MPSLYTIFKDAISEHTFRIERWHPYVIQQTKKGHMPLFPYLQ